MAKQLWKHTDRTSIVCVDSYEDGVLRGRFCDPFRQTAAFSSLSQFLIKMEELLDERQTPQSYTSPRTFPGILLPEESPDATTALRRGQKATFELKILFRQHTSWQGTLLWREKNREQPFRSVLELVILMDSALRALEGSGAA